MSDEQKLLPIGKPKSEYARFIRDDLAGARAAYEAAKADARARFEGLRKKPAKAPKGPRAPRKSSPWMIHLAAFRRAHPELKPKEVMRAAAASYRSKGATGGMKQPELTGNPWNDWLTTFRFLHPELAGDEQQILARARESFELKNQRE